MTTGTSATPQYQYCIERVDRFSTDPEDGVLGAILQMSAKGWRLVAAVPACGRETTLELYFEQFVPDNEPESLPQEPSLQVQELLELLSLRTAASVTGSSIKNHAALHLSFDLAGREPRAAEKIVQLLKVLAPRSLGPG